MAMTGKGQIINLEETESSVDDDQQLEEKVGEMEDVFLEPGEANLKDPDFTVLNVGTVLVKRDDEAGAIWLQDKIVQTGPNQKPGHVIILVECGLSCMFLGKPSV
ncbi:uncharacterized protein CIMG_13230 [Coccidioides immitis RS]|uniref:Uncharacterized protein n=1 Tax=Coccidioides immitis (strain RS) TaxID=246410 RepID=A0A0D8JTW9_COCIM|nr:uncharacterized protein CIMG_13230 [Coccidioides immitis RS]KJF60790.1 hypothetical protein CIMG_13230 [Coccidioides immitis RS]